MHVGNLRTAILAWTWARRTDRSFVMRIEDIDRVQAGAAARQLEDLSAIGLDWDGEPLIQSDRRRAHVEALTRLREAGDVFECYCSRREVREAASAPHVPPGHYPGTCLDLTDAQREERRSALAAQGRRPCLRLRAPASTWTVHDDIHGEVTAAVDHFVLQRSDGVPAYNLAVVVDDGFQGVDQVTRGDDLLGQAPGQACLATLLGIPVPDYVHVPLAVGPSGARLAKRDGAVTMADLRALGWDHGDVVEWIGESLGVHGARRAADIAEVLDLGAVSPSPWVVDPPQGPLSAYGFGSMT
ncbi:MAG: tRNA glutamyl-Q(34) synthetase GluQRS [Actinomyces sp.]|nr:tRNA glutamyl-Q(34) synthetase GluQRS [Actinomyces sp.]